MEITELFNTYHKRLFNYCKKKYKVDYDTCHELVQLTFLKVLRNNNDARTFTYLKFTLSSIFIDNCRRKKRQPETLVNNDYETIDFLNYYHNVDMDEPDNTEILNRIKSIAKGLSPKYKKVFEMFYYDNLEHTEIAEYLGINVGTSRSNLYKAKNKIIDLIK